jgi:hypothetical protein
VLWCGLPTCLLGTFCVVRSGGQRRIQRTHTADPLSPPNSPMLLGRKGKRTASGGSGGAAADGASATAPATEPVIGAAAAVAATMAAETKTIAGAPSETLPTSTTTLLLDGRSRSSSAAATGAAATGAALPPPLPPTRYQKRLTALMTETLRIVPRELAALITEYIRMNDVCWCAAKSSAGVVLSDGGFSLTVGTPPRPASTSGVVMAVSTPHPLHGPAWYSAYSRVPLGQTISEWAIRIDAVGCEDSAPPASAASAVDGGPSPIPALYSGGGDVDDGGGDQSSRRRECAPDRWRPGNARAQRSEDTMPTDCAEEGGYSRDRQPVSERPTQRSADNRALHSDLLICCAVLSFNMTIEKKKRGRNAR